MPGPLWGTGGSTPPKGRRPKRGGLLCPPGASAGWMEHPAAGDLASEDARGRQARRSCRLSTAPDSQNINLLSLRSEVRRLKGRG